jgi:hypothetical protein
MIRIASHWVIQTPKFWLRTAVIVGVLLLCAFLPFASLWHVQILLVGLVGLVGVVSFIRWPPVGLIVLIFNALFSPALGLPGGFNFAVLQLILLLGMWAFDVIAHRRPIQLIQSRTVWPWLVFAGACTLSFVLGQLPWFSYVEPAALDAQIGGLAIFVLSAGIFLFVACRVNELAWLERLTWVYLALGGLFIVGWLSPLGQFTGSLFQRHATSNSVFWIWLVALAFSQAVFNRDLHKGWRLALGGLVLATLYVAYFRNMGWKSGYLPAFVAIAAIIACRSWRLGLAMALIGILPAMYLASEAIETDEYSYSTRLDAWIIVFEMVKVSPVFGFGPANYYWYTPLFPIRGYAVVFNSHNQYVDIIAQVGLLGMACFVWVAWEIGWLGIQLRNRAPPGFARAYVYGALGGLAGMLASGVLADWFFPFPYNIGLRGFRTAMLAWMFLGGLVAIEQILRRQAQS